MFKIPQKLELERIPESNDEERFSDSEPVAQARYSLRDSKTGTVWGYVVVDNTRRGPGLGGIRITPDLTLSEISRLARAMTLKNSAARLPYGGGKSGLIFDPHQFSLHSGLKSELIGRFAEAVFEVPDYITAPDMGTDEIDIQQIYEFNCRKLGTRHHARGGAGRPPEHGGVPIDDWGLTAHSLFASIETAEKLLKNFNIAGSSVVIQGYGNVGAHTAAKLSAAGANIVGASDIHAGLWHPQGLDVAELNRCRRQVQGLAHYTGPVTGRFSPSRLDWLMEAPCDLLIPAARPDAITARNADRIQCRMIFQGANTPSNKMTEYYLQNRRGILSFSDFIVNVGGVMGCAVELQRTLDPDFNKTLLAQGGEGRPFVERLIYDTVSGNVETILSRLKAVRETDRIFREEAMNLAEERLSKPQDTCFKKDLRNQEKGSLNVP